MNPKLESKVRRIEKLSVWLRATCTFLLLLTAVVTLVAIVAIAIGRHGKFSYLDQSIRIETLTGNARLLLALLILLTGALYAKGTYHLRHLLDNYSRREIFTNDSAKHIRQFGYMCIACGVLKIAWVFLPLLVLPPPNHTIMVPLDTLVTGAAIVVISWFTEMATNLREENELTI